MSEDGNGGSPHHTEPPADDGPLGGGMATISGAELEAAVERVMRRLGAQTRSDGGSALPGPGATPPTTETPPVTSAPMTSAVSLAQVLRFLYLYNIMQHGTSYEVTLGNG
jgi:hypothetical protein